MIVAGIDCGTKNIKAVIYRNGEVISKASVPSKPSMEKAVQKSFESALDQISITETEVQKIGLVRGEADYLNLQCLEVTMDVAIAKAARYFFPEAHTVIDIGAEEAKAVRLDEKGNVADFVTNERCAASAGAYLETMANVMGITIEEMGTLALKSKGDVPINAQCVIFAEHEVGSLLKEQAGLEEICETILSAMASRIVSMMRRIGIKRDVVMFGFPGRNIGLVKAIAKKLNMDNIYVPEEPEFGGAIGAAIRVAEEFSQ